MEEVEFGVAIIPVTNLGLCNSQRLKQLRVLDRKFNHFFDLLNLLIKTSNHFIGRVWHLLHHHEGHKRVHLVGQDFVQRVAVVTKSHAAVWSYLEQQKWIETDN